MCSTPLIRTTRIKRLIFQNLWPKINFTPPLPDNLYAPLLEILKFRFNMPKSKHSSVKPKTRTICTPPYWKVKNAYIYHIKHTAFVPSAKLGQFVRPVRDGRIHNVDSSSFVVTNIRKQMAFNLHHSRKAHTMVKMCSKGKKTHISKFVAQNKIYPPLPDNLYAPLLEILKHMIYTIKSRHYSVYAKTRTICTPPLLESKK